MSTKIHYYVSHDSDWVVTRVAIWLVGLTAVDLATLFDLAGVDIPAWLRYLLEKASEVEICPVEYPGKTPLLPSLSEILSFVPRRISSGNSLPVWGGYDVGGFTLAPGGDVVSMQIPYDCVLSDIKIKGAMFFLQSGAISGHLSVVTQALVYYRREVIPPVVYPGIDVNKYYPSGNSWGFATHYSPLPEYFSPVDPLAGAQIAGWHDYDSYVLTWYVPLWQFPKQEGGGYPYWHFLAGNSPFAVSTAGLSSGLGYIQFNKPYPSDNPKSFEPNGFNAVYPSNSWLSAMGMQRLYFGDVSGRIERISGGVSDVPPVNGGDGQDDWINITIIEPDTPVHISPPFGGFATGRGEEEGGEGETIDDLTLGLRLYYNEGLDATITFNGEPLTSGGWALGAK